MALFLTLDCYFLPEWEKREKKCRELCESHEAAADPALIIYTSGTTGRPKGNIPIYNPLTL